MKKSPPFGEDGLFFATTKQAYKSKDSRMDVRGLNGVYENALSLCLEEKNTKSFEFKSPQKSNHFFVDTYIMHILTKMVYMPQWRSLSLLPYSC